MKRGRFIAVAVIAAVLFYWLMVAYTIEPPNHKTRQDHMDQLDRIEQKLDTLVELGKKWQ